MDGCDPEDDEIVYPALDWPEWNCRCVLIPLAVPWIVEVSWIADEIFGDTNPRIAEFFAE